MDALGSVQQVLEEAELDYALIGAYAVNAWIEPRLTADIDIVAVASVDRMAQVRQVLARHNYVAEGEQGAEQPSGPDFIRFREASDSVLLEIQIAKTDYQSEVVRRAQTGDDGIRIATPEDLIIMKLIAYRPKDRIDLEGLVRLPQLDWRYIEHWAGEWGVSDRLTEQRAAGADEQMQAR